MAKAPKPKKAMKKTTTKKRIEVKEKAPASKPEMSPLAELLTKMAQAMKETAHFQHGDAIQFPIEVQKINTSGQLGVSRGRGERVGGFVAVRPAGEQYAGKTYLGLYIGDIPIRASHAWDPKKQELNFYVGGNNPAIFVFDLNKVIFGAESWWGEIESEEKLKEITNNDIENVWYVKAFKQMVEREKKETSQE